MDAPTPINEVLFVPLLNLDGCDASPVNIDNDSDGGNDIYDRLVEFDKCGHVWDGFSQ